MDYKCRTLFVIKHSKGCKFMPKVRKNTSGGWTRPALAEGLRPLAVMGAYFYMRR